MNCQEYFKNWKKLTEDNDFVFLSDNTFTGFMVTLTSVIEVMQFLCTNCNYLYLMTSRLNQDALEVRYCKHCNKLTSNDVRIIIYITFFLGNVWNDTRMLRFPRQAGPSTFYSSIPFNKLLFVNKTSKRLKC